MLLHGSNAVIPGGGIDSFPTMRAANVQGLGDVDHCPTILGCAKQEVVLTGTAELRSEAADPPDGGGAEHRQVGYVLMSAETLG
jgi:hypothetical protein